ncbi:MAG: PQQ-dependent sugar dehydrogenase [Methylophaga sp.]|nr:PQQ-dependent sugar dehydrogenase [Methylophaga sp.]
MTKPFNILALSCALIFSTAVARADIQLDVETIASGLGIPWGLEVLPDNSLLITQRSGEIIRLDLDSGNHYPVEGGPEVRARGQGGLLDVTLSPDHAETGWIYFTYSKPVDGQGATTLARAKLDGNTLTDWQDLLVTQSRTNSDQHYGSRISFDNDGHVFFSIGDRGKRHEAQDTSNHIGTILRVRLDGSIPEDNPFVGRDDALPEIWSYGHRNPQGVFFNQETGLLWSIEHGPRGGDEINLIEPGLNYGWPVITYGKEYFAPIAIGEGTEKEGMEQPVKEFTPSTAPGALIQYQGTAFSEWQGDLLSAAMALQHLNRVVLNDNNQAVEEHRYLNDLGKRMRSLVESPEGWLYIGTDSGEILRVRPAQ